MIAQSLAVVALVTQLAGCNSTVKHPAATASIVGGTRRPSRRASSNASDVKMTIGGAAIPTCPIIGADAASLPGLTVLGAPHFAMTDEEEEAVESARGRIATRPRRVPNPLPDQPKPAPPPPVVPEYLKQTTPEVYMRSGGSIVRAPVEDQNVVRNYPSSPTRGPIKDGQRITILTARTKYRLDEPVRVLHILDAPEPGHDVYVMGPKAIYGEFVDGTERTPPQPPVQSYDGRVVPSPAVDYNYEITSYTFNTPGIHLIQWKTTGMESNVIAVEIAKPAPPASPPSAQ